MNYLLDTCVLSEFTRRKPDEKVVRWMDAMDEEELFISVITLGEIQRGIEKLPDSHRKTALLTWMNEDLIARFGDRVLPIDVPSMLVWGTLTSRMDASGTPMGVMDSLLAASALSRNMVLVTRNVKDFTGVNLRLVNPWE
jgi:predicted nucleic acid-binding protein